MLSLRQPELGHHIGINCFDCRRLIALEQGSWEFLYVYVDWRLGPVVLHLPARRRWTMLHRAVMEPLPYIRTLGRASFFDKSVILDPCFCSKTTHPWQGYRGVIYGGSP